jgi:alpha-ribazole phosphatase/probable phosphoglycerate mutase
MARLILARHGQTAWNVEKVFRGRAGVALDDVGTRQAELLGRYLGNCELEAIYTSPVKRALDTASIVARYQKVAVRVSQGLTDLDFGKWQSLPEQEVKRLYPAILDEWRNRPHKVRIPGGESLDDVTKRTAEVVDEVLSRHNGNVLLVSHRVVIKVLICYLLGLDNSHFWNIRQDVAGITIFSYTDRHFVMIRHNDTSHLRELQEPVLGDF